MGTHKGIRSNHPTLQGKGCCRSCFPTALHQPQVVAAKSITTPILSNAAPGLSSEQRPSEWCPSTKPQGAIAQSSQPQNCATPATRCGHARKAYATTNLPCKHLRQLRTSTDTLWDQVDAAAAHHSRSSSSRCCTTSVAFDDVRQLLLKWL